MSPWIEFAVYSVAVPAATALAAAWVLRLVAPAKLAKLADRYALPLGLAAGFFVGYWLLPDWAALSPTKHWHWLPWLGGAAVLAAMSQAEGVTTAERLTLLAVLAALAAWKLVPLWAHLSPPRHYYVTLLAGYLFALMALLAALPDRLLGRTSCGLLLAAAVASPLLIAIGVSARMGQVAAIAAAATAGGLIASLFSKHSPQSTRSLLPIYAVLVGGTAYAGVMEYVPPHPLPLLPPAVPLLLWLFACFPLARLSPRWSATAQWAAVLAVLFATIAWVAITERGS
jgi:hypothetical protein